MKGVTPKDVYTYPAPRRDKFEVWCEILEACLKTSRTQTWILRNLRLKTAVVKDALDFLQNASLIVIGPPAENIRTYITTQKGEGVLNMYYSLISQIFQNKESKKKET